MKSLVVDNGAYFIKVGYAGDDCRVVPNCIFKSRGDKKRAYIADQVHELNEKTGLFLSLPFERGYLLNWDVEQQIWDHVFSPFEPNDTQLALTDPIYTVPALEDLSAELLFEDFGFAAVHKSCVWCNSRLWNLVPRWIASSENLAGRRCCLVVDCGYSFTHIVPLVDGNIVQRGVIRIDVGGKALTNQLKEWISYRELQVMEETFVINECKEDACFVSLNFDADMKASRSRNSQHIRREYVLPDFVNNCRGFLREIKSAEDNQQRITLGVERFGLPEALFRPCEIGLKQMGIGEAVAESVRRMDINVRGALLKNIHVVGGSTLFPNFRRRLSTEIRANVEDCYDVCLADVANAITHGWTCGSSLAKKNAFPGGFMTRAEYEESGDDFSFNSRFLLFAKDEAYEDDLKTMRITKDEKSAA